MSRTAQKNSPGRRATRTRSKSDSSEEPIEASPGAPVPFEAALAELEAVVARMESGELSLDESLAAFERGVALTRQCQQSLKAAELKVQTLTADGSLEPLPLDALDDD